MNQANNFFTKFVNISLKILFIPVLIECYKLLANYVQYTSFTLPLIMLLFTALCFYGLYQSIKKNYKDNAILLAITILALMLRVAYALSINNHPVSDFSIIYDTAERVLNGDFTNFKGSGYIARFPHLTIFSLYFALIRKFFTNPLIAIKVVNSIFSAVNVPLIYNISKECFNNRKKPLWAAMIIALYPPLVVYPSAYNTENIAIPLFLASIYVFILVMNNKKTAKWLLLSGFFLTLGNLFRMVGQVVVVAYIMFIFIYFRKSFFEKGKGIIYILSSFVLPLVLVSNLLIMTGITEFQLWRGSEPFWTSVLKGTNMESYGRWNKEDAGIVDKYNFDYDKIAKACKAIITQRLTSASPRDLAKFYLRKYTFQWREGDFSASYWAQLRTDPPNIMINLQDDAPIYAQLYFFLLVLFSYIGLYNKEHYLRSGIMNLFYIIFCGYALFYLITESQDRYSFIVCWLFPIFSLAPNWESLSMRISRKKSIPSIPKGRVAEL